MEEIKILLKNKRRRADGYSTSIFYETGTKLPLSPEFKSLVADAMSDHFLKNKEMSVYLLKMDSQGGQAIRLGTPDIKRIQFRIDVDDDAPEGWILTALKFAPKGASMNDFSEDEFQKIRTTTADFLVENAEKNGCLAEIAHLKGEFCEIISFRKMQFEDKD